MSSNELESRRSALEDADLGQVIIDLKMQEVAYRAAPAFTEEHLLDVGAGARTDADVFVVTTLDADGPVANLLAPVLVNSSTGAATQVILDGSDFPLGARLARTA